MLNPKKNMYEDGKYWLKNPSLHEEDAKFKSTNFLKIINKNKIEIKNLLDIGCGSGKFLNSLFELNNQIEYTGIDLSSTIIETAKSKNNKKIKFENITFDKLNNNFTISTLNDVFEHVDDYIGFLKSLRGISSYYYFNIPLDMNVLSILLHKYQNYRNELGHLHYFSKKTALETLKYCGYEILDFRYNISIFHQLRTQPSFNQIIALLPRIALILINKDFGIHLLGGASLSVLCR